MYRGQNAGFFNEVRTRILRTAEIAENTISRIGERHYALANLALVGEAVMLAMRTHTPNLSLHSHFLDTIVPSA